MQKHRLVATWTAVALFAILLAACGSATNSSSTKKSGVIPVGFIASSSGAEASSIGGTPSIFDGWIKSVNDSGGIDGHMLKGYVMDDQLSSSLSVQQVHQLVEQDHVVAIVGETSPLDSAWAPYVASKGIPVIGGLSIDAPMFTNPDFFPTGANLLAANYGVLKRAASVGKSWGFLYCAELCSSTVGLNKAMAKSLNLSIPVNLSVAESAPDYTAQCQAIKSSGVASYQPGTVAAADLRIISDCDQQGVTAKIEAIGGTVTNAFAAAVPNGLLGVDYNAPWFDTADAATDAYRTFLAKYVPNLGSFDGPQSQYVWVAGQLFQAAAKAAGGTITSSSLKRGLYAISGTTLNGLTQPLTFSPGKPTVLNCWFDFTTAAGKFVAENGLKPQCGPNSVIDPLISKVSS